MIKLNEILVEKYIEEIKSIEKDITIGEAIELLRKEKEILPVVDKNGKLIGCFRDIDLLKIVKKSSPLAGTIWKNEVSEEDANKKVEELMDTKPLTILPNDTIEFALSVMNHNNVKSLIVVDNEGKLLGILRLRTIFNKIFEELK
jgi:predicted transcriptional regulator